MCKPWEICSLIFREFRRNTSKQKSNRDLIYLYDIVVINGLLEFPPVYRRGPAPTLNDRPPFQIHFHNDDVYASVHVGICIQIWEKI
jgi:hypothetical protein